MFRVLWHCLHTNAKATVDSWSISVSEPAHTVWNIDTLKYGFDIFYSGYLLTRTEGKVGSPEKPLSDLGLISYRSYWKDVLLEHVCSYPGKEISIKDLSQEMAINAYDIVSTLQALGMMKYWKGKHIVLKKRDVIEEYQERAKRRGPEWRHTDSKYLRWRPFVVPQETPPWKTFFFFSI